MIDSPPEELDYKI